MREAAVGHSAPTPTCGLPSVACIDSKLPLEAFERYVVAGLGDGTGSARRTGELVGTGDGELEPLL